MSKKTNNKKVLFVMPHMIGGGAERVASLLINRMRDKGIDTLFLLTADERKDVIRCDLDDRTPLLLAREEMPSRSVFKKTVDRLGMLITSALCKPFEAFGKSVPAFFAKLSVISQNKREIQYVRSLLVSDSKLTVIAFLQPAIPITLLAARGLPNKVIISERADPSRLMKKRYGQKFIEKYYTRANIVVFQTQDAKNVYPACISKNGIVIPNPLKPGLPKPYHGERNYNITTFCRISKQKNLTVLVHAFTMLHKDYPNYVLRIIGDSPNAEGDEVMVSIKEQTARCEIEDAVVFEPFMTNVHEAILKDAMYVNSSDYEGISNAMLEAMAIGMPVVCTDCPIGGARATISDGENGLLVPVGDAESLYMAMKRIVEDEELSMSLSSKAASIREKLSIDSIAERWISVLGETDD